MWLKVKFHSIKSISVSLLDSAMSLVGGWWPVTGHTNVIRQFGECNLTDIVISLLWQVNNANTPYSAQLNIGTQDPTNSATHGTRWFPGHVLHQTTRRDQDVRRTSKHSQQVLYFGQLCIARIVHQLNQLNDAIWHFLIQLSSQVDTMSLSVSYWIPLDNFVYWFCIVSLYVFFFLFFP